MIIKLYKKKGVRKIIFTLKREKHSFAERLSEKKLNVSRSSLKPPKFKLRNSLHIDNKFCRSVCRAERSGLSEVDTGIVN